MSFIFHQILKTSKLFLMCLNKAEFFKLKEIILYQQISIKGLSTNDLRGFFGNVKPASKKNPHGKKFALI